MERFLVKFKQSSNSTNNTGCCNKCDDGESSSVNGSINEEIHTVKKLKVDESSSSTSKELNRSVYLSLSAND